MKAEGVRAIISLKVTVLAKLIVPETLVSWALRPQDVKIGRMSPVVTGPHSQSEMQRLIDGRKSCVRADLQAIGYECALLTMY